MTGWGKLKKTEQKHSVFIREYLLDGNGVRSAIAAGYAAKSAHVTASRLLRNAKVREELDRLNQERAGKLEITGERILRELAWLASPHA